MNLLQLLFYYWFHFNSVQYYTIKSCGISQNIVSCKLVQCNYQQYLSINEICLGCAFTSYPVTIIIKALLIGNFIDWWHLRCLATKLVSWKVNVEPWSLHVMSDIPQFGIHHKTNTLQKIAEIGDIPQFQLHHRPISLQKTLIKAHNENNWKYYMLTSIIASSRTT